MCPVENKWLKVGQKGAGPGARSSHAMTVVGNKVYCFGGELKPTIHIDNDLYVFDLGTQEWSIAPATGEAPFPCFGVSMVTIGSTIYVYGGRDDKRRYNGLHSYDTETNEWKLLSPVEEGLPGRSYHSMAGDDRKVYVFGGVTAKGRVNTLHAYDVVDQKWVEYPAAGEACKGRGAPGLVVVEGRIWVLFGFDGNELGDIHCFDLASEQWKAVETTGDVPAARSVFPAVSYGKYIVIYGGEEEPHELMHMGAGKMSGEVYQLDTETLVWERIVCGNEEEKPSQRGWCAFTKAVKDGEEGLLVHGGNSPTNERLDDLVFWGFSHLNVN
ncbi:Nitrile-specifier protein 5 [Arabidopsis thaliana]|uniref:thiohydroximate-O-sulfate sulfate/sulfur-lyase (nitrile-forming) n=3 Tax=Arabidopsis TaxID=3701 RepID=A0A178UDK3_ARATH|nr:Kelch repeat type 1 [Arabidopsis thaliana x Arabidopsis arenosa]KAG7611752.1 Kelch-type beta propeller [Arabidopsis suecica]OAO91287.1 NSP5 [Arabidopsis thaliana]VYS69670.1 unnamed protein product [Arabidopsis thaliana]